MNEIQRLIHEMCPDGVPMVALGEIGIMTKGSGIQKADFTEKGKPCIHYGQVHTRYYLFTQKAISNIPETLWDKCKKAAPGNLIIATTSEDVEACCKSIAWLGHGEVAVSGDAHIFSHNQDPKYISYLFQTEMFAKQKRLTATGAKVVRVSGDAMLKYTFPLPPLPIQQRIVEILDKFTSLVSSLDSEIALRQKQYEYYRNKLLSFEEGDAKWVIISDLADNYTGLTYKPANVSETGTLVLRSSNIQDSHLVFEDNVYVQGIQIPQRALVKQDDVLICVRNGSRALIGKCAMIDKASEGMAFGAFMSILRAKDVNPKYLYYVWQLDSTVKQYKGDDAAPINQITSKDFSRIKVQVPSLDKQLSIVRTLDTFESLLTNLKKERELRQKQYEYYREKLLTFA